MGMYSYKLDDASREGLLADIPAKYPNVAADHITYKLGKEGESMPELNHAEIIGVADNGRDTQVAIVRINGSVERPDGKTFHIPWSVDKKGAAPAAFGSMDSPDWKHQIFDKPIRFGADAVYIGDDKSITPVRLHGATPDGIAPGSIGHVVSPEATTHHAR